MKIIKNCFKYIVILIMIVATLVGIMTIEAKLITRNKKEQNLQESISVLKSKTEVKKVKIDDENTYLHVYADEIILNIIYCINPDEPLKPIMNSNYYEGREGSSLEKAIQETSFGTTQYMRYWHGSTMIIRPLLMLFNIEQIYYLFAILLIILLVVLVIILIKKKTYLLIFSLIIGLIITTSQYVPFCLEYVWTYLIMLISAILGIFLEKKEKGNAKISLLMFITGIMTCFFDFLSTETLTFTIPILIIFIIRNKEQRIKSINTEVKQIIKWMILWLLGYSLMWASKWILSSIILNVNALDYVINNALNRIVYEKELSMYKKMSMSILRNVKQLEIVKWFRDPIINTCILIGIAIGIFILKKQDKKEWQKTIIILGIGIIPYIRYCIIQQHSYYHFFFTFRAQLVTIISIILAIDLIIDKSKLNKKIEIIKKN